MPKKKVYPDDEVHFQLYATKDANGIPHLSHAIINGVRYYPEDFKGDFVRNFEQILTYHFIYGWENVTP